jgi:hypothetical protein
MQVQDLISQDPILKWMLGQMASSRGTDIKSSIAFNLHEAGLAFGRNLFRTRKDFIGIGPADGNGTKGSMAAAAQVGDVAAITAKVVARVILRSCEEGRYPLVGSAHIGSLLELPCFGEGALTEPVPLRIR